MSGLGGNGCEMVTDVGEFSKDSADLHCADNPIAMHDAIFRYFISAPFENDPFRFLLERFVEGLFDAYERAFESVRYVICMLKAGSPQS